MFKKNERGKDGNKCNPFHKVLKKNLLKKKKKSSRTKIQRPWSKPKAQYIILGLYPYNYYCYYYYYYKRVKDFF